MPASSQARKKGVQSIEALRSLQRPFAEMVKARILRRRRLARRVVGEAVGPRLVERRQLAVAAALPRHRGSCHNPRRSLSISGVALRVRHQRRGHADRPAGVEHMDHRPLISGIDPERGMHLAGRRAADQQRQSHVGALHLARDRHHLVERRRDQPAKADHVRLIVVGGLQDVLPRHHHAKVDHLEAVALQDHADDVLADVVDVALDGRHDDPALALGRSGFLLFRLDEGDEVRDRALHHAGRLHHLRQEHLARSEQVADDVHAVHQRAFDHLDRPGERLRALLRCPRRYARRCP